MQLIRILRAVYCLRTRLPDAVPLYAISWEPVYAGTSSVRDVPTTAAEAVALLRVVGAGHGRISSFSLLAGGHPGPSRTRGARGWFFLL